MTNTDTPGEALNLKALAMERARQLVANYGSDPEGLLVGAIAAALAGQGEAAQPATDLRNCLKSVLYHFGPEGAHKVSSDVLALRTASPGIASQAEEGSE